MTVDKKLRYVAAFYLHAMKKPISPQARTAISITLFLLSISIAIAAPQFSKSRSEVWVAARDIPAGVQLTSADILSAPVTLHSSMHGYLETNFPVIGSISKRLITSGEIINAQSISSDSTYLTGVEVGVSVRSSDLPSNIHVGDLVSVFQIHDARNGEAETPPLLVLETAFISQLSHKGANFGSDFSVTLTINRSDLALLLQSTSSGRLALVGRHG